jgi:hypothetical protein
MAVPNAAHSAAHKKRVPTASLPAFKGPPCPFIPRSVAA